ncbi:MAG: Holliday junction resolvase RuvX [Nitriliruptoraceae bacterium]
MGSSVVSETPSTADELPLSGRLVGFDLGEVRVGVAVTDPSQIIASPAETIDVPRGAAGPLVDALVEACRRHEAAGVVVGHPRRLDGREGDAARRAREVAGTLATRTGLTVALWDERFTTVEAERVLLDADLSRAQRRETVDGVAASVLLQAVVEAQRRRRDTGS